jgi:hypothetical protein
MKIGLGLPDGKATAKNQATNFADLSQISSHIFSSRKYETEK